MHRMKLAYCSIRVPDTFLVVFLPSDDTVMFEKDAVNFLSQQRFLPGQCVSQGRCVLRSNE